MSVSFILVIEVLPVTIKRLQLFCVIIFNSFILTSSVLAQGGEGFVVDAMTKANSLFNKRYELVLKANSYADIPTSLQLEIDEISSQLDKAIAYANRAISIAATIHEEKQMIARDVDKINSLDAAAAGN